MFSLPWKAERKRSEQPRQRLPAIQLELTEEQKETQEVFRKFQSILNKLTPQNLTELADATLQLKINTEERLKGVIDVLFTKVRLWSEAGSRVYKLPLLGTRRNKLQ